MPAEPPTKLVLVQEPINKSFTCELDCEQSSFFPQIAPAKRRSNYANWKSEPSFALGFATTTTANFRRADFNLDQGCEDFTVYIFFMYFLFLLFCTTPQAAEL